MKTHKFFLSAALLFNLVLFSSFSSSEAFATEAVKGAKGATAKSSSEMTAEETANGGVKSPYPACSNMLMVENSDFQKKQEYWKKRTDACDPKVANCSLKVQVVADSGVFATRSVKAGVNVSSAVPIGVFLESVRVRAGQDLSASIKAYEQIKSNCLGGKSGDGCDAKVSSIRTRVGAELPKFRNAVAMLDFPQDDAIRRVISSNDVSALINQDFDGTRIRMRAPKLAPLSSSEFDSAKTELARLLEEARKDAAAFAAPESLKQKGMEAELRKWNSEESRVGRVTKRFRDALEKNRVEKLANYHAAVSRVPEVAYVGSSTAEEPVIAAGLTTMIADGNKALKAVNKAPVDKNDLSAAKVDSSLLQYAAYSALINKMLVEEMEKGNGASSCAAATSAFNQLKTVQGENAGIAAAAIIGVSVGLAVAGPVGGLIGGAAVLSGATVTVATNTAIAVGLIGGFAMTGYDISLANTAALGARTGLVTQQDADEARSSATLGIVASPLNFLGSGAMLGAGVAAGAKVLSRFGANAVANGSVKVAGTSAEEVAKAAANATAAAGKATASKEAAASLAQVEQAGDKGATAILGRKPTSTDESAFRSMADSSYLGTAKAPNFEVARAYASVTQTMSEPERVTFAANLEKISKVVKSDAVSTAGSDAVRNREAGLLALEIAKESPDVVASAAILKQSSGWGADALRGAREVMKAAWALAKGVKESVSVRTRKAIAKLTGKKADSPEVYGMCGCIGACAKGMASNDFDVDSLAPPVYVACTN